MTVFPVGVESVKSGGFAPTVGVWAKADAYRLGLKADSKDPADEAAVEVPNDPAKLRVGHAWGRLWVSRHNTRIAAKWDKQSIKDWPKGTIHPFGLAGIALGQKERQ